MKKNLLYLLMFLAMPLAFVACGDDEDGDNNNNNGITTPINATGEYDGDIEILINGENMFEVDGVPSTADSEKLTLNGTDMGIEKNIIGIDVVINSITGAFTKVGAGNLSIEAEAPLISQTVNIEISAQKK